MESESLRLEKSSRMAESNLHLNPSVAIKANSATSAWHLDTSRGGDSTASLGEEGILKSKGNRMNTVLLPDELLEGEGRGIFL